MKVEHIMVKKIVSIDAEASVYEAIEKLVDRRLRSLLVKPKNEKDVYGVITVRDIVFKLINKNLDPHKITVEEIASKPVVCINKEMDTNHAVSMMQQFNIARVFVCEGMDIIGIVSISDVMASALIDRAKGGGIA